MPTNDFIGFASNGSANIMSQADFAAAAEQGDGVQPGMASSALANKVWRQGANMASVIGELIKNHGIDALDNGDLVTLYNALLSATASTTLAGLMSAEDKVKLDTIIESGSYTPSLEGATIAGVATYTKRKGYYVKIGKLVYITGEIEGSFTTLPDGRVILTGLPYVVDQMVEQASFTVYGYSGGVSNSLSRLVNATAYNNFLRLHVISSRETADRGLGKIDWASWSNTSSDSYYLYITSEASSFHLFWGGCYMTA